MMKSSGFNLDVTSGDFKGSPRQLFTIVNLLSMHLNETLPDTLAPKGASLEFSRKHMRKNG
jgi:hypothetical protein